MTENKTQDSQEVNLSVINISGEPGSQKIDPWNVSAETKIDYQKLIRDFGSQKNFPRTFRKAKTNHRIKEIKDFTRPL